MKHKQHSIMEQMNIKVCKNKDKGRYILDKLKR